MGAYQSEFQKDTFFMEKALKLAKKAAEIGEVPVGALVVSQDGEILGRGYNQVEKKKSQIFHAEMLAIKQAGQKLGDWRLTNCTLYCTLEPCLMCEGAILLSRFKRLVFAANAPEGFLDKSKNFGIYNSFIMVSSGICEKEASNLLKSFFNKYRREK